MSRRSLAVQSLTLRSLTQCVAFGLASALLVASPIAVFAEDTAPVVDNSKVSFAGTINSNAVYVRSGPGENYYATVKLDKGAQVTVVGLKFDWLKIIPPDGSFSYVAKAYVEKRGDGTVGRVTKPDLNVRCGSDLNAMKTTVQTKLDQNEDVAIIGEQDEYFKIKPPQGAYLYVNKQFVDPVKQLPPIASNTGADTKSADPISSAPVEPIISKTPDAPIAGAATTQPGGAVAATPTTQGSEQASAASTQPITPTAEAQFDTAENAFLDASNLPLEKQPIDELLAQYTALGKSNDLPVSMQRIADMRIATLKLRSDAKNQYVQALKMQEDAKARQLALKAEQEELTTRVKEQDVTIYSALGTLRTSSLQQGGQTMYRLTDPGTGRTLLYIRTTDAKYAGLLNQFIGVRGEITEDTAMNLKLIAPTDAEAVDQSKVNTTVTAQVIPPTLLPKAPTASINSN